jgi:hypothetical protein
MTSTASDLNNNWVVLRLQYGRFSVLPAADIMAEAERTLLSSGQPLDSLVLKVAHHGGDTSLTLPFLQASTPSWPSSPWGPTTASSILTRQLWKSWSASVPTALTDRAASRSSPTVRSIGSTPRGGREPQDLEVASPALDPAGENQRRYGATDALNGCGGDYWLNSSSSALPSWRSGVWNPSVNQS